MQLWQLTDKDSSLRGYICMPILIQSEEEIIVKLEAEAYIVPGMMVPILLGEDYQLNYKVGVMRNLEEGTQIYFGETDFKFSLREWIRLWISTGCIKALCSLLAQGPSSGSSGESHDQLPKMVKI